MRFWPTNSARRPSDAGPFEELLDNRQMLSAYATCLRMDGAAETIARGVALHSRWYPIRCGREIAFGALPLLVVQQLRPRAAVDLGFAH